MTHHNFSYIFLLEEVEAGVGSQHEEPPAPFRRAGSVSSGNHRATQLPKVTWARCHKTFYVCSLQMFVISNCLSLASLSSLVSCL
jgi:hypothetical protein